MPYAICCCCISLSLLPLLRQTQVVVEQVRLHLPLFTCEMYQEVTLYALGCVSVVVPCHFAGHAVSVDEDGAHGMQRVRVEGTLWQDAHMRLCVCVCVCVLGGVVVSE